MPKVGFIEQSNGTKLPQLGLGTWLANDHTQLKDALRAALDIGYRYIDTAAAYGNEDAIGEVLQEYYDAGKLQRSDIFLTTKLPLYAHEPEMAQKLLERSLKNLHTNYLDLYLMHTPLPCKPNDDLTDAVQDADGKLIPIEVPILDTWRVLEEHYKAGVLKSIGISNFNARQIKELHEEAEIKPQNLQIEMHILLPQKELLKLCRELCISVTSYSTLGSPGRGSSKMVKFVEGDCLNHPIVQDLTKRYGKTEGQILLRNAIQKGVSVIPKSTNRSRLEDNFNVFDFEISAEDEQRLDSIGERTRLLTLDFCTHHHNYPFNDDY